MATGYWTGNRRSSNHLKAAGWAAEDNDCKESVYFKGAYLVTVPLKTVTRIVQLLPKKRIGCQKIRRVNSSKDLS